MADEGLIQSACVVMACNQSSGVTVLLAKRTSEVRMAPGHWVFPGGALEAQDRQRASPGLSGPAPEDYMRAALRELAEEVGVGGYSERQLVHMGEWITPTLLPRRYRTRFYLLATGEQPEPQCDGVEILQAMWISPSEALAAHAKGELDMMFPTVALLDWIAEYPSVEALSNALQANPLAPVLPELKQENGRRYLGLPTGSGYRLQRWYVD
ncbi:NUDIX domain-containing protein [Simiduia sp. 21SJ11W-1]|uniref:NUDIX hydrolase n=1 Tax=Simiduia sp. 21SJ11W-1 TaxID=2909669 RepID=UPI00209EE1AB|nr:NUDIX domain-containing protein [Simiduia sp. 21SJ11W-1]UTA46360.1 NUDIX domain-containing protein [Simiduia sp. 21SJ11W-1]